MRQSLRADILRAAAAYLKHEGCSLGAFSLTIRIDEEEFTFHCKSWPACLLDPAADSGKPLGPRPGWRRLSRLEERIMGAARAAEWLPGPKLAEAAGEDCTDAFKAICANLVEAGLLESAPGRGYRLAGSPEGG